MAKQPKAPAKKPAKPKPKAPKAPPPSAARSNYEAHKNRMADASRQEAAASREIGPLPEVADQKRRAAGRKSLRTFCETYLKDRFPLQWSNDHIESIGIIEGCLLSGGMFAWACQRGFGKTTLTEASAIWAIAYGLRRFVVLIGATDEAACQLLDSIKMEVETNELLAEDFPEICYPVRVLEGINNRAPAQTLGGERTRITWTADEVIFPTVAGSASSGSVIRTRGLLGAIRGMKHALPDGTSIRPDFFIADDPQTDASAISMTEIDKRERRLKGAIKGLAGPGKTIAGVIPCTVIAPRDLSDRLLDRDRNPQFQGRRMKMLYAFPNTMELWHNYAEVRRNWLKNDKQGDHPNDYYKSNRQAMDEGANVAWLHRFDPANEVSALQAAMNLWADNPREFMAEYQNSPESESASGAKELVPGEISKRLTNLDAGTVRNAAVKLTAFIDCGGGVASGLAYAVCDWDSSFGGSIIDYGSWPKQNRRYFAWDDLQYPLIGPTGLYKGMAIENALYRGLEELTAKILGKVYRHEDGREITVSRCLIDAGWQTPIVYQFARQSKHNRIIWPSKGVGRNIGQRGVSEWKPRPGEDAGNAWRLTISKESRGRSVQFDPDVWKTFLYERFTTPVESSGGMALYGRLASEHDMIADHLAAESSEPMTIRGITFDKWTVKPGRPDNHLLDCVVGCAVAASVAGMEFRGQVGENAMNPPKVKKKINIEELYKRANG